MSQYPPGTVLIQDNARHKKNPNGIEIRRYYQISNVDWVEVKMTRTGATRYMQVKGLERWRPIV